MWLTNLIMGYNGGELEINLFWLLQVSYLFLLMLYFYFDIITILMTYNSCGWSCFSLYLASAFMFLCCLLFILFIIYYHCIMVVYAPCTNKYTTNINCS